MRSQISLLPDEFKRRNKLKKQLYYILTTVASLSVFLALIVTFVVLYRLTLKSNLFSLQQEGALIKNQISSMQKFEDLDNKIVSLERLLTKTSNGATNWRNILINFSTKLPAGVNISDFSANTGKDGQIIKIKGYSIDNYRLGLWIQNLRGLNEPKNIQCSYSERKKIGTNFYSEYEISASLSSSIISQTTVTPSSREVKK